MLWRLCAILLLVLLPAPAKAGYFAETLSPIDPPREVPSLTFTDANGQTLSPDDFHGRVVVLNLWATWCAPCAAEMPKLDALRKRFGDRLAIVALTEDHDGLAAAKAFYHFHDFDGMPVYADTSGNAARALKAPALPVTLVLDAEGREIARADGAADWSSPAITGFIAAHLSK
jgi:thiol-disulfide isomerase/thioredoxin